MLIVKALASGSSMNRLISPNYKPYTNLNFYPNVHNYDYMREINLGRDWELWINLKQAVMKDTVPLIKKIRNPNNSYFIKVIISKYSIDASNQISAIIPIYFKNRTADYFYNDYYHTKIPTNTSIYNSRSVITSNKIHEVMTVNEPVYISIYNIEITLSY